MRFRMVRLLLISLLLINPCLAYSTGDLSWLNHVDELSKQHKDKSGIYILEKGEDALISRAWLADNASQSIDIQYFIWSTDNIGTLAAASLLRAADRGIHIRVLVDDLLVDASNEVLYALAVHPNIEIKIYNPNINIGTSFFGKLFNTTVDFKGINQRMHNKIFIVDKKVLIAGGRNMADEYFDYHHEYNFRDRDVLMAGKSVHAANQSFSEFWNSSYSVTIESLIDNPYKHEVDTVLIDDWGDELPVDNARITLQREIITSEKIADTYHYLRNYESDNNNYTEEMRKKIKDLNKLFFDILDHVQWVDAEFISDLPGKNQKAFSLKGGGKLTSSLADVIISAKKTITIQTPYLIMSWDAWRLFRDAIHRGVKVRINTNSLSSTDNLPAYSGYARQRNRLLNTGIEIFEFKPNAKIRTDIINRYEHIKDKPPIFAIHAKSMVVDGDKAFIGSFNFDPRSENLNTEVGIFITDSKLAKQLESAIEKDMLPENSWNVKTEGHGHDASLYKHTKVFFLKLVPMDGIL